MNEELKIKKNLVEYEKWLRLNNLSPNSITSYINALNKFFDKYKVMTKDNLLSYKGIMSETLAVKTANLRIVAINSYVKWWCEKTDNASFLKLQLKQFTEQKRTYLENVVSNQEYRQFLDYLKAHIDDVKQTKRDKHNPHLIVGSTSNGYSYEKMYYIIRCIACTGVRISELTRFSVYGVRDGYFDLVCKGGKVRRIYIAKSLQAELLEWIDKRNITGFLFINREGDKLSERGIAHQMKSMVRKAGLNEKVFYPHSFRHLYAKNFLARRQDLALLSDLLGHSSIETTRIYLRMTSEEQKQIVDSVVDW